MRLVKLKSVCVKEVGPWTADGCGVNESHFVAMVATAAVFSVGKALWPNKQLRTEHVDKVCCVPSTQCIII
jgi:hypothetical protein